MSSDVNYFVDRTKRTLGSSASLYDLQKNYVIPTVVRYALYCTVPRGICVHFLSRAFLGWIVSGDVVKSIFLARVDICHPGVSMVTKTTSKMAAILFVNTMKTGLRVCVLPRPNPKALKHIE